MTRRARGSGEPEMTAMTPMNGTRGMPVGRFNDWSQACAMAEWFNDHPGDLRMNYIVEQEPSPWRPRWRVVGIKPW